jgi:hypothetical protein
VVDVTRVMPMTRATLWRLTVAEGGERLAAVFGEAVPLGRGDWAVRAASLPELNARLAEAIALGVMLSGVAPGPERARVRIPRGGGRDPERGGPVSDFRSTTYDTRLDDADDVRAPQWEEAAAAGALVLPEAPLAADDVTGNLARYARWQWRDFWQRRGFWLAGAALFGVWLLVYIATYPQPGRGPMPAEEVANMAQLMFAAGGALAGLLGTGGLVARERERGLQRFLFAKPVRILRYYRQGLAINGVGSLIVIAGAVALAALALPVALPVLSILALAAAAYVLTSGVVFLASTLIRFDVPLAAGWLLAGFPVAVVAQNMGWWWARTLQWLFPQGWVINAVLTAFHPSRTNQLLRSWAWPRSSRRSTACCARWPGSWSYAVARSRRSARPARQRPFSAPPARRRGRGRSAPPLPRSRTPRPPTSTPPLPPCPSSTPPPSSATRSPTGCASSSGATRRPPWWPSTPT